MVLEALFQGWILEKNYLKIVKFLAIGISVIKFISLILQLFTNWICPSIRLIMDIILRT